MVFFHAAEVELVPAGRVARRQGVGRLGFRFDSGSSVAYDDHRRLYWWARLGVVKERMEVRAEEMTDGLDAWRSAGGWDR